MKQISRSFKGPLCLRHRHFMVGYLVGSFILAWSLLFWQLRRAKIQKATATDETESALLSSNRATCCTVVDVI